MLVRHGIFAVELPKSIQLKPEAEFRFELNSQM
jgi:hypothetical protein